MQLGPQPKEEDREGGDRQIPAVLVAGGEGEVAREVEWTEVNLLEGSGERIGGRRVLVGVGPRAAVGEACRRGCSGGPRRRRSGR